MNDETCIKQNPLAEVIEAMDIETFVKASVRTANPLPPLPLTNGALFIDNSVMSEWKQCPEQFKNRFLLNRTAAFEKPALNFGSGIHDALKWLERGFALESALASMADHFVKVPQPPDDHRSPAHAEETIRRYIEHHKTDQWKVLQTDKGPFVEFPFAYKLFDSWRDRDYDGKIDMPTQIPIFFCGKIDLAIEKGDGTKWIVDHKTTFQLGKMFSYEMKKSAQMRGYCWAFKKATGSLPSGYIVDAIRTNSEPKGVTNDCLLEDSDEPRKKWWREQFFREPFYIDQAEINEWELNTIAIIEQMLWHHSHGYFPQNDSWCVGKYGRCQFYDVCSLPVNQRPLMLQSNMFVEDTWTPLNKPTL
mgnify:CR=1 FL=1